MLSEKQIRRLAEYAVAEHQAGENPYQQIRAKWASMTPAEKAAHNTQATAWATAQERQRRAAIPRAT